MQKSFQKSTEIKVPTFTKILLSKSDLQNGFSTKEWQKSEKIYSIAFSQRILRVGNLQKLRFLDLGFANFSNQKSERNKRKHSNISKWSQERR